MQAVLVLDRPEVGAQHHVEVTRFGPLAAGADWRTNYQTQFKWFVNYCNQRYGSITGAYAYWKANSNY